MRPKDTAVLTQRQKDQLGWLLANPDLRMGGPTQGWRASWSALNGQTAASGLRSAVKAQVTLIAPGAKAGDCAGFARCHATSITSVPAYQLGEDGARQAWIAALTAALAADHGA